MLVSSLPGMYNANCALSTLTPPANLRHTALRDTATLSIAPALESVIDDLQIAPASNAKTTEKSHDRARVWLLRTGAPVHEPMYVFDEKVLSTHFTGQYDVPPALEALWGAEIMSHAQHQFYLGPDRSGSPFHFHGDAFNVVLYGHKQWWLAPPSTAVFSKQHPNTRAKGSGEEGGAAHTSSRSPITCIQHPGDMLYVPRRWSHSILNHGDAIGIAVEIDNNYCSHPTTPKCVLAVV